METPTVAKMSVGCWGCIGCVACATCGFTPAFVGAASALSTTNIA